MIKSMTGFGRSEIASGNRKIMVEMKSVNHRFLEASIKMPKKLNVFEARIRDVIKKYASRGKIDELMKTVQKTMSILSIMQQLLKNIWIYSGRWRKSLLSGMISQWEHSQDIQRL